MKYLSRSLMLATLVLVHASTASACPMCKYALESDAAEPQAYMVSILFMMGMISTLFASVGGLLWWVSKQEKLALTAAGYQHVFENAGSQPYQSRSATRR